MNLTIVAVGSQKFLIAEIGKMLKAHFIVCSDDMTINLWINAINNK